MQTFLPYADFRKSAQCLDNRRLGKQRVECWQIYLALTKKNYGWKNHPAVKMWSKNKEALLRYGWVVCNEWCKRCFKDSMKIKFDLEMLKIGNCDYKNIKYPNWFGNKAFHDSHKSNLLRKDFKHYSQFDWKVKADLPYVWSQAMK